MSKSAFYFIESLGWWETIFELFTKRRTLLERIFMRRGVASVKRLFKGSILNPFLVKSPRIKRAGGEYFLQSRQFDRRKSQKRAGLLKAINSGYNLRNFFEPDRLVENYEKYFFSLMKVTVTRALRFKFMTRFNMKAEFNLTLAELRRRWGFIARANRRWLAFYKKFCGRLDWALPWLGLAKSKVLAGDLIDAGLIYVNGKKCILRGRPVGEGDIISVDPFFYNEMKRADRRAALRALYGNLFAHSGLLASRVINKAAMYFVPADEGLTGFRPGAAKGVKRSSVADVKQMLFSINIKNILTGGRVGFLQKVKADRTAFGRVFQTDLKEYISNLNSVAFAKYFNRSAGSSYSAFIKCAGYDLRRADFIVRFRNSAVLRRFPTAPEQLYRAAEITRSGRLLYFYNPAY